MHSASAIRSVLRTTLTRGSLAIAAGTLAVSASTAAAPPVAAAGPKVVIVVGPTNGSTASYLGRARAIAAEARSHGARVTEVFTPDATWARVAAAARGANLFVYLGHGNGSPSPYGPLNPASMDGLGLNPVAGAHTTAPVKYYGERTVASGLKLAPGAVVLLNHLCYASGSGEPGMANPSWAVARKRVDNFAAGFIAAGAGAVIADAHVDVSYTLRSILSGTGNVLAAWRANPQRNGHEKSFASTRHAGYRNYLDPEGPASGFYRAITTRPGFTLGVSLRATTVKGAVLRASPSEHGHRIGVIGSGASLTVTGALRRDSHGRTWAPVRTAGGRHGYVAAWLLRFGGSAAPLTAVILRTTPSIHGHKLGTVRAGSHVTVIGTRADGSLQVWLKVRTSTGRTGWMAAWLMKP